MSFFAHAVQWRRQMYTAPLGLLLFLARSLLLKEKQWVEYFNEVELNSLYFSKWTKTNPMKMKNEIASDTML